ncbi:uncharacterized protein BDZ99DRAFT_527751 [Mytilinidion resinicola]|uniref:Uncharacterized protein n=1 Tax=Mytilinidion resinicola TaxID=574789 RepID=A0A6A6Y1G5_9PEZI|nr:uncharacterized protein BDZ99DRAFT_527751 [Mytilinidion resinicola]KAF2802075.1 hypothetical protein BDZ99DRAFT_527751 [Mytilinidion resinicola]
MPTKRSLHQYGDIPHAPLSAFIGKLEICRQFKELDFDDMPSIPEVPLMDLEDVDEISPQQSCTTLVSNSKKAGYKDVWVQAYTDQQTAFETANVSMVHVNLVDDEGGLMALIQWPLATPESNSALAYSNLCNSSREILWSHPMDYEILQIPAIDLRMFSSAEAFGWRKASVESILHSGLYDRFVACKFSLVTKLGSFPVQALLRCVPYSHRPETGDKEADKKQLVDFLTQPRLSFYGKKADWTSKTNADIISTTTDAYIALGDADWYASTESSKVKRVLVCACLLGLTARVNDNHTAANGFSMSGSTNSADTVLTKEDWIYADAAQVLPVFEIQFEWRPEKKYQLQMYAVHASALLSGRARENKAPEWCCVL